MNHLRPIAVFVVIGMSIGLAAARSESKAESKADKKVEDNFKVSWTRISYSKTVSLRNPEVSEYGQQMQVPGQGQDVSERVSLYCEVEMLDPNFVLGISRAPMIEEMTDGKGGKIEIESKLSSSFQTRYEAPRTRPRFVAPQKPAKWKTAVRSALKLPPKESSRPRMVEEVQPSRMQIDLSVGLGEQSSEKIGRVKGYFYALVAESFEYVDVPFKSSDKWIRLTPDVEVQIRDAWCKDSSYRLSTKGRPEGGGSMRPLSAESYMPARLLVGRQLVGPDDKPVRRRTRMGILMPYRVGGKSTWGGSPGQITKIRYVIAVNPTHHKIPFVLENISLPRP